MILKKVYNRYSELSRLSQVGISFLMNLVLWSVFIYLKVSWWDESSFELSKGNIFEILFMSVVLTISGNWKILADLIKR
jgi:hypothetical protein